MEERWLFLVEGTRLYIYRSWTRIGVYEADFEHRDGEWRITRAVVAEDADEPGAAMLLELLIEGLLSRHDQAAWDLWVSTFYPPP